MSKYCSFLSSKCLNSFPSLFDFKDLFHLLDVVGQEFQEVRVIWSLLHDLLLDLLESLQVLSFSKECWAQIAEEGTSIVSMVLLLDFVYDIEEHGGEFHALLFVRAVIEEVGAMLKLLLREALLIHILVPQ